MFRKIFHRMAPILVPIVFLAVVGFSGAQAPATPPPPATQPPPATVPQLSETAKIALVTISKEYADASQLKQQADQHLQQVLQDVAKDHPGYHLDLQNMTVVRDVPPDTTVAKPEPKPAPKPAAPEKK